MYDTLRFLHELKYKDRARHRTIVIISFVFEGETSTMTLQCGIAQNSLRIQELYMRTLPSHVATTDLLAICEGKVHMIFSWSSKGTHIAPLENNDIHVHLHTLHFQSFRTRVISYLSHFVPKSFRRMFFISYRTHFSSSGR